MLNGTIITEAYEPDDDLQELLEDVLHNQIIDYSQKKRVSLSGSIPAIQLHQTVEYKNETIIGRKTVSSLGVFCSLKGDPEITSALILALSLKLGEPTLMFEDRIEHPGDGPDYKGMAVEWIDNKFAKKGLSLLRLEHQSGFYETTEVSLGTLEERAERWLSSK